MEKWFFRFGVALSVLGTLLLVLFFLSGSDLDDRGPFFLLGLGAPMSAFGYSLVLGVLATRLLNQRFRGKAGYYQRKVNEDHAQDDRSES